MPWIKKNLTLVVSGAVTLVLIVLAVLFLFSNINKNADVLARLNQQTSDLERLVRANPYPSEENVRQKEQDAERVQAFLEEARRMVPLIDVTRTNMSNREFKTLLEGTVADLQRRATNSGVMLPRPFDFSFGVQRRLFDYATNSVPRLSLQLEDVKALSDILIASRVNVIENIRRVPVSIDDQPGRVSGAMMNVPQDEYLSIAPTTNGFIVSTPYELSFRGFTEEVHAVLDGLLRATNLFIVKSISVQPAGAGMGGQYHMDSYDMTMYDRSYSPRRPGPGPGPGGQRRSRAPVTVLSEAPLSVRLLVDSVRRLPEDYVPEPAPMGYDDPYGGGYGYQSY